MSSLETVPDVKPRVRHKTFTYRTSLERAKSGRSGLLSADGKPALQVSSPPEFKGEAGRWTPEDLFVAAIDICTMTTFAAYAERAKVPVVSYRSQAEGVLEYDDGGYRFTAVVLRPHIVLASADARGPAEEALRKAHEACLVGRSVRSEVRVEPRFEVVCNRDV